RTVLGVDATFPEIRAGEVFLAVVPEQLFDVLAYERRCVVAGCLEAVYDRRRASEQVLDARPGRGYFRLCLLAIGYVAPRTNHLDRLTLFVPNEPLFVINPTITAVPLAKPVLDRVSTFLEQAERLGLHRGELVRVYATAPEIRVFQVLLRLVAQPFADVLADEGRREISGGLIAVDYGRCGG